jgi:signal transduction histidine kinase
LEFVARDPAAALRAIEPLTGSADPQTQGEAWLRIAQLARSLGRVDRALDAYDRLAALEDTVVSGYPAGLAGRQGRALTLAAAGRDAELASVARELSQSLEAGRWVLVRTRHDFARHQARTWLGLDPESSGEAQDVERAALAEAAEAAWHEWQRADPAAMPARGRTTRWVQDRPVLVLTRSTADRLTLMLVTPRVFEMAWRGAPVPPGAALPFGLALTDATTNRLVVGSPPGLPDRQSSRGPATTDLPWTVRVTDAGVSPASLSRQAVLMLVALGVMLCVVGAGGYLITRTLARDLRIGRMQSDFVSAVSHEFRTPLTTVRHLSELLARDRVSTDERRREFYGILLRESDRLQRLVENLLHFGRLESGALGYRFQPVSLGSLLRDVVQEFRDGTPDATVHLVGEGSLDAVPAISADRDVLARVFWNLLDNAVKYSPAGSEVRVELGTAGGDVVVKVRDRGIGIPAAEHRQIFEKFVRGTAAKAASIQGTGIGLAMAREILRAHGGEIAVESEEGQGSTFIVRLPVAAGARATAMVEAPGSPLAARAATLEPDPAEPASPR